jgi:L-galactose dehydrogenase
MMSDMKYRSLGRTGLNVSIIGFGAATLGNEYGNVDAEIGKRAVHAAIEHGINFFDTSSYYGRTLSETRLGEALLGYRHKVILATKGGRIDLNKFDFSAEGLTRSLEDSLIRLKTDVIDLYQLHDIEFADKNQIIHESLPTLYKLREQGLIRFIGITGYPLHLLKEVAEQVQVDTILSYCHYNLLNTTLEDVLMSFTTTNDIGLINASPLHMGVLTEYGAPAWHPAPLKIHEAARQVAEFARKQGNNITSLALQFVLQNETIASTLIGMKTIKEVTQNVRILDTTLDSKMLDDIQTMLEPVKNIDWQSGRPEHYAPDALPVRS